MVLSHLPNRYIKENGLVLKQTPFDFLRMWGWSWQSEARVVIAWMVDVVCSFAKEKPDHRNLQMVAFMVYLFSTCDDMIFVLRGDTKVSPCLCAPMSAPPAMSMAKVLTW